MREFSPGKWDHQDGNCVRIVLQVFVGLLPERLSEDTIIMPALM